MREVWVRGEATGELPSTAFRGHRATMQGSKALSVCDPILRLLKTTCLRPRHRKAKSGAQVMRPKEHHNLPSVIY